MKNRYISTGQMDLLLKKGRHERSKALAKMFSALSSLLKKYLSNQNTNPPKTVVCEQPS